MQILLIDDDERLGELLTQFMSGHAITLECAARPSTGLKMLHATPYDLLILDVMLPEMDGFELCKKIRAESEIPIIMLTARGDVMDRVVGLELGADDYLPKPFEPRELVARINRILSRSNKGGTNKHVLQFGDLIVDLQLREARLNNQILDLSTMEYGLVELFTSNPGKMFTRDEILNALKGIDAELFTRSVDVLVSRVRQKLKPLDCIKTVRGTGYVFVGRNE
ncbi:MAG: response regulator transcription factor [Gammaproteobacteria bacterium]|nr:response regulator transcription factor [Gammaproteobacteria bacterium]MDH5692643.1 response regulator transcription factor [Gammaproteobacteria bacterium]